MYCIVMYIKNNFVHYCVENYITNIRMIQSESIFDNVNKNVKGSLYLYSLSYRTMA